MRKHHSSHRVARALVGLSGAFVGAVTLSFSSSTAVTASTTPTPGARNQNPTAAAGHNSEPTGYWLADASGSVAAEAGAPDYGSAAPPLPAGVAAIATTPDDRGYWLAERDGHVQAFGQAGSFGQVDGSLSHPIVGMTATPDGQGYWLVASDGGIFSFGDASFYGSAGALSLQSPVVGMTATPDGRGYWLVAADGGVFTYGDAQFFGSAGSLSLSRPILGITATGSGRGYWLYASDGGVFTYGDAGFYGSASNGSSAAPVVDLVRSADSAGYRLVDGHGNARAFGDAVGTSDAPAYAVTHQDHSPTFHSQAAADSPNAKAERFAMSQVGKPYAYGASGPNAYDCSGLVYRSYLQAGLTLPRTASGQYGSGRHVPLSDLQPGDLVFWATNNSDPSTIYHVAIYVGDGRVVNATHSGGSVTVMSQDAWGPLVPQATRP